MYKNSTANCVVCFEKATCFGGHVHKLDGDSLIAGFCKSHFHSVKQVDGCKGCYGYWDEKMGEKEFMTVGFIDTKGFHKL